MAIPTTSVSSSAQLAAGSTGSGRREVSGKTRRRGEDSELGSMFVFWQYLLYIAEEHDIQIFRKALLELDIADLFVHLHVRFDNAVDRFRMQSYVAVTISTRVNQIAKQWNGQQRHKSEQGCSFLHGENEVQNKQGHHEHQQHRENCQLELILPPVQSFRTVE